MAAVAPLLFYAFALLVAVSAWTVVLGRNIVRMAVSLLLTLAGVAGIYFMLEAEFLAAIQLIVYAGGILILIVFGIMLTGKSPFMQLDVKPWERGLGVVLGVVIAGLLIFAMVRSQIERRPDDYETGYSQIEMIGKALLTTHLVAFEIAAVLLLVVMIGAAYMARRRDEPAGREQ